MIFVKALVLFVFFNIVCAKYYTSIHNGAPLKYSDILQYNPHIRYWPSHLKKVINDNWYQGTTERSSNTVNYAQLMQAVKRAQWIKIRLQQGLPVKGVNFNDIYVNSHTQNENRPITLPTTTTSTTTTIKPTTTKPDIIAEILDYMQKYPFRKSQLINMLTFYCKFVKSNEQETTTPRVGNRFDPNYPIAVPKSDDMEVQMEMAFKNIYDEILDSQVNTKSLSILKDRIKYCPIFNEWYQEVSTNGELQIYTDEELESNNEHSTISANIVTENGEENDVEEDIDHHETIHPAIIHQQINPYEFDDSVDYSEYQTFNNYGHIDDLYAEPQEVHEYIAKRTSKPHDGEYNNSEKSSVIRKSGVKPTDSEMVVLHNIAVKKASEEVKNQTKSTHNANKPKIENDDFVKKENAMEKPETSKTLVIKTEESLENMAVKQAVNFHALKVDVLNKTKVNANDSSINHAEDRYESDEDTKIGIGKTLLDLKHEENTEISSTIKNVAEENLEVPNHTTQKLNDVFKANEQLRTLLKETTEEVSSEAKYGMDTTTDSTHLKTTTTQNDITEIKNINNEKHTTISYTSNPVTTPSTSPNNNKEEGRVINNGKKDDDDDDLYDLDLSERSLLSNVNNQSKYESKGTMISSDYDTMLNDEMILTNISYETVKPKEEKNVTENNIHIIEKTTLKFNGDRNKILTVSPIETITIASYDKIANDEYVERSLLNEKNYTTEILDENVVTEIIVTSTDKYFTTSNNIVENITESYDSTENTMKSENIKTTPLDVKEKLESREIIVDNEYDIDLPKKLENIDSTEKYMPKINEEESLTATINSIKNSNEKSIKVTSENNISTTENIKSGWKEIESSTENVDSELRQIKISTIDNTVSTTENLKWRQLEELTTKNTFTTTGINSTAENILLTTENEDLGQDRIELSATENINPEFREIEYNSELSLNDSTNDYNGKILTTTYRNTETVYTSTENIEEVTILDNFEDKVENRLISDDEAYNLTTENPVIKDYELKELTYITDMYSESTEYDKVTETVTENLINETIENRESIDDFETTSEENSTKDYVLKNSENNFNYETYDYESKDMTLEKSLFEDDSNDTISTTMIYSKTIVTDKILPQIDPEGRKLEFSFSNTTDENIFTTTECPEKIDDDIKSDGNMTESTTQEFNDLFENDDENVFDLRR